MALHKRWKRIFISIWLRSEVLKTEKKLNKKHEAKDLIMPTLSQQEDERS